MPYVCPYICRGSDVGVCHLASFIKSPVLNREHILREKIQDTEKNSNMQDIMNGYFVKYVSQFSHERVIAICVQEAHGWTQLLTEIMPVIGMDLYMSRNFERSLYL